MKQKHLNISIDALPIHNSLQGISDYLGLQIFSLTALPLLYQGSGNEILPLGAEEYIISEDGLKHTIKLKRNLKWSDGSKITPEDYRRTIFYHLSKENRSPLRPFLQDIYHHKTTLKNDAFDINKLGVQCNGQTIQFNLEKPNYKFKNILTAPQFSPLHPSLRHLTAGPYSIQSANPTKIILKATCGELEIQKINFIYIKDPENTVKNFTTGKIDITCDTCFPYSKIRDYRNKRYFNMQRSNLFLALQPENIETSPLKNIAFRQAVLKLINRNELSKALFQALVPIKDFFVNQNHTHKMPERDELHDENEGCNLLDAFRKKCKTRNISLSIAYDPFYPNRIIADEIRKQLRGYDVELILMEDNYYRPHLKPQMRLRFLFPPFQDSFGLYFGFAYSRLFSEEKNLWGKYIHSLFQYQASLKNDEAALLQKLNAILIKSACTIPLFMVPRIFLKRTKTPLPHLAVERHFFGSNV